MMWILSMHGSCGHITSDTAVIGPLDGYDKSCIEQLNTALDDCGFYVDSTKPKLSNESLQ